MCTVTVVPRGPGLRLVCNRDEKRTRPPALPPARRAAGGTTALWPVDPAGGGTWIGANDAGVAMVLLNRTPRARTDTNRPATSRGTIIPALLRCRRVDSALSAAANLRAADFEPFTLLVLQGADIGVVTNTNAGMSMRIHALTRPMLYTSSSLGDHLVVGPRRALFARMVERLPARLQLHGQAAFHCHRWRRRPSISVLMERPDAATVSRTVLDVDSRTVSMQYIPVTPSS